jgi:hypothetical protein
MGLLQLQQYKISRIIPTGDEAVSSKPKENGQQDPSEDTKSGDQGTLHTPLPKVTLLQVISHDPITSCSNWCRNDKR